MATASELQEQLKKAKRELREIREEVKELRIREKLYLERLDNWAEKNQYLNNKISNMTMDEVAQMQKAKAEYNEKYLKDKEVAEAFDKQAKVKLGNLGGE
jgi:demethoxyubiquinone hydroxylase (CLK1/Coq7/Cat5 family)|tara:strand:+ start:137 stop:436 length:300 start_codon:yes stop_codon:yes gene_type:complete